MENFLIIIIVLTLSISIFFICRGVMLWYFQIERRANLLEDQKAILNQILNELKNKTT